MGGEEVHNGPLSDRALVYAVKNALSSVKNGDTDQYDQLVELMYPKDKSDVEAVAQQETILKTLSRSVAFLDVVRHEKLFWAIFGMKFWDQKPNVMDALLNLIISLAITDGMYLESCLNFLVSYLLYQPRILNKKRQEVLYRVHAAFDEISYIVPLAPSKLDTLLEKRMPKIYQKDNALVTYVDSLLKLENTSIGKVVGCVILNVVMARLRDLDVEIGLDDILQEDSSRCMFEDAVEGTMDEGEEFPVGSLNQNLSDGTVVSDLLDKLMVLSFEHLESCQNADRLDEVFENLFESFKNLILNTQKSKFPQFVMFYACSLDPKNCGEKFASKLLDIYLASNNPVTRRSAMGYLASYLSRGKFLPSSFVATMLKRLVDYCAEYCRRCNDDANPFIHEDFYLVCQAIMYVLCFRMRSILDVPHFQSQLIPVESVLSHKLNPLMVCHPSVVSEFLKRAKACGLFILDDLVESELSCAVGGPERLHTFFPFNPCLLKLSNSFISPKLVYWSKGKTSYEEDDEDEVFDEVIVNGDTESEEDYCDDENELNKMSITPQHSFMGQAERLLEMPSRIRPSTSPCESL